MWRSLASLWRCTSLWYSGCSVEQDWLHSIRADRIVPSHAEQMLCRGAAYAPADDVRAIVCDSSPQSSRVIERDSSIARMGRTPKQVGPALAIKLIDQPHAYCPGDVILGTVLRKEHVVNVACRVTIRLLGRSKTKALRPGDNSRTYYRGQHSFFAPRQLQQTLYDGPIHVPPGNTSPASWPFSITIPEHADPTTVSRGSRQTNAYISLEPEDIVEHPLPATYHCSQAGWSTEFMGFVEYWLEATLRLDGVTHVAKSTFPVRLRALSTPTSVIDVGLKASAAKRVITTLRLLPGMEDAELSLKQRAQQLLHSSKVPNYRFMAQIKAPSVIQLEHPTPIPFLIRILPLAAESSEAIRDTPQMIALESVEIQIRSYWQVICPGTFSGSPHTANAYTDIDLGTKFSIQELKSSGPIMVPKGEDARFLNLGERLELAIGGGWIFGLGRGVRSTTLSPSFKTYNIRNSHTLKWSVTFRIAGEDCTVTGDQPVRILGPSEEREAAKRVRPRNQSSLDTEEVAPPYEGASNSNNTTGDLPSYQEAIAQRI